MLTPGRRRRRWPLAAAVALVLIAAGVGAYAWLSNRTGDISHPDVPFQAPVKPAKPKVPRKRELDRFTWPVYGYTKTRTRYLPASARLRPPFRTRWAVHGRTLIEFPPVIYRGMLYLLKDNGRLFAIDMRTGKTRWKRKLGRLAAASPAVGGHVVYCVLLVRNGGSGGRVVALSARRGKIRWSRPLPSRAESSPLLDHGRLYFGSEDGTVYALRARDGRQRWTYRASGAVKGGPALRGGILYFGDYGGHVHAVRARDGRKVWSVGTSGARFGFGSGSFYSTPAVAFGRVYLGNTDSRVYSFAASDGRLAWAKDTGGYVYGSPAVADIPRLGPTVYIGSYDGNFYALDARSGRERWHHAAGGKISGSATIVGDVVYFANLAARDTIGLNARSGRRVFFFGQGGFNPVVSDGRRIYLAGYGNLFAMVPRGR